MDFFPFAALVASALFAGGALYVSVAEHPGRMEAGVQIAAAQFGPSYRRAAGWQGGNAAIAAACGVIAAFSDENWWWLVGAVLIGAVIPWTLVVMMQVNRDLLEGTRPPRPLLERWAQLHAVRAVLGTAGFAAMALGALA